MKKLKNLKIGQTLSIAANEDINMYLEAGEKAQPEVKKAIGRFRQLGDKERDQVLLWWLLGSGTPEYKMSKADSDYKDQTEIKEQTCGNCEYAYTKSWRQLANHKDQLYICSQISGAIKPEGWCKLWKKGKIGQAPEDK